MVQNPKSYCEDLKFVSSPGEDLDAHESEGLVQHLHRGQDDGICYRIFNPTMKNSKELGC